MFSSQDFLFNFIFQFFVVIFIIGIFSFFVRLKIITKKNILNKINFHFFGIENN